MKMIPPVLRQDNRSSAEALVFDLLRSNDGFTGGAALHSVGLAHHRSKASSELDFVIVTAAGILVLEVKGGGISQHDGCFFSTDRYGQRFEIQNPFRQANSAEHSLREQLERQSPELTGQFLTGHAVVFPQTRFRTRSVEWAPELVIDQDDCLDARTFAAALQRAYDYWQSRVGRRVLNGRLIERICRELRPEFECVLSTSNMVALAETQQLTLTQEQLDFIDTLTANQRVLCTGGAGTGKTVLLAEAARRFTAQGLRTLVTCYSPLLAGHLQQVLAGSGATVMPFDQLEQTGEAFDVLLVDEAQDVMSLERVVEGLDSRIRGGIAHGRWVMFYDPNFQARIFGQYSEDAERLLLETGASRVILRRNCRNTREIVAWARMRTGADIGVAGEGSSLDPTEYFWTDPEDQARKVGDLLRNWRTDSVNPQDVVLLSPVPFAQSVFSRLPGGVRVSPWQDAGPTDYRFAQIDEFKGMESRYVIVGDLSRDTLTDENLTLGRLYVAISRARHVLWLMIQADAQRDLDELSIRSRRKERGAR